MGLKRSTVAVARECRPWRVIAIALTLFVAFFARAEDQSAPKRVLVIFDENKDFAGLALLDRSISSTLKTGARGPVEVYTEYMDLARFRDEGYEQRLRDFYRQKYGGKKLDLVMAVMGPSLDFALRHGSELFPGVPIVFCGIDRRELDGRKLPPQITGILVKREFKPTLELALRVHPQTRNVYFIAGTSPFNRYWTEEARRELREFEGRVAITYLTELPMEELRSQVARLPANSIILYLHLFRDGAGMSFQPQEAVSLIAEKANAPIYVFFDQPLGYGPVGGFAYSVEAHGREAANVGVRLLNGETAANIPVAEVGTSTYMFDWRQLRRWEINEALLPKDRVVLYRAPSLWSQHKRYIITAISICIVQATLIAVMLVQRLRRKSAEAALRANQERLALALTAGEMNAWEWTIPANRIWINGRSRDPFALEGKEGVTYEAFLERVHPQDREAMVLALNNAMCGTAPFEFEHRVVSPDGRVRWITSRGRLERDAGGKPFRMQGVSIDVTMRIRAEREAAQRRNELAHLSRVSTLSELSGSLAHELNQPLTAILSNAQAALAFMARGGDDVDLAELKEILRDIVDEDKRAGEVIQRLRLLLRKGEVQKHPLDMNEVVLDVLKLARSDLLNHSVMVDTELAPQVPPVLGDRVQLQQVLLNLVLNACDAMAGNADRDRSLVVRSEGENGMAHVSVIDCGQGIPADGLDRVFEPFFTTKAHGMGLGLAVCRTIVTAHGGTLAAKNNADRGATFHMRLPVAAEARGER